MVADRTELGARVATSEWRWRQLRAQVLARAPQSEVLGLTCSPLHVFREGWWLNRKFCCWEMVEEMSESGVCDDWQPWTEWVLIQWAFYVALAVSQPVRWHLVWWLSLLT